MSANCYRATLFFFSSFLSFRLTFTMRRPARGDLPVPVVVRAEPQDSTSRKAKRSGADYSKDVNTVSRGVFENSRRLY